MVLPVWGHAATLVQGNTLPITEDEAGVTLTSLHTGGGGEVTEDGEEVGASGGAGGGAV